MFDRYQIVSPGDLRDAAQGMTALVVMGISLLEATPCCVWLQRLAVEVEIAPRSPSLPASVSAVFRSMSRT
jgi:hypothetical protein